MSTVEEIEAAIARLPKDEFWSLTDRLIARREKEWDVQIEADARAGRLDRCSSGPTVILRPDAAGNYEALQQPTETGGPSRLAAADGSRKRCRSVISGGPIGMHAARHLRRRPEPAEEVELRPGRACIAGLWERGIHSARESTPGAAGGVHSAPMRSKPLGAGSTRGGHRAPSIAID